MFKLTLDQYLQYFRIAIQMCSSAFGYTAFVNGSKGQIIISVAISLATLLWTAYATRLAAKVNELVGADVVEVIVTKDKDMATQAESPKVMSLSDVNNPNVNTSTDTVSVKPI